MVPTTTLKLVPAVGFEPPLTEVTVSADAFAGPTATARSGLDEIVPSVAWTLADSALYSVIEPPAVATPFVNVIVSAVPNATAVPLLLVTVGLVESGEAFGPEKVSEWSPV